MVNIIFLHFWGKGEGPIWSFNEHKDFHFDNAYDIHMSSKNNEESGCGLHLDLLSILYMFLVVRGVG